MEAAAAEAQSNPDWTMGIVVPLPSVAIDASRSGLGILLDLCDAPD
jgi:hypothetical protein